jgi:hypothetical protein
MEVNETRQAGMPALPGLDLLENTMVALIAFAGTGKYTIGRELCTRTGAKLIDNHLINNPVFTVVNADGITPLPKAIWGKVKAVRRVVYESIKELSPPDMSFVFTIQLIEDDPEDGKAFVDLVELAAAREILFVPIRLICDVDELCRRIVNPARSKMLKEISPDSARRRAADHAVLNPSHPNLRTLDVTLKSAIESAEEILREVKSIRENEIRRS